MRKIIITLLMIVPVMAHAENMCVKDGSIMVVLDPNIAGTALSNDANGKTWSTQFSYGIISGIGACYSSGVSGGVGAVATNQNLSPYTDGTNTRYCYCKMLRPVESVWVYWGQPDNYDCSKKCAQNCSSIAASSVTFRIGLFSNLAD